MHKEPRIAIQNYRHFGSGVEQFGGKSRVGSTHLMNYCRDSWQLPSRKVIVVSGWAAYNVGRKQI